MLYTIIKIKFKMTFKIFASTEHACNWARQKYKMLPSVFFYLEFNYRSVCFIGKYIILIHMSFEVMIKENKNTQKNLWCF